MARPDEAQPLPLCLPSALRAALMGVEQSILGTAEGYASYTRAHKRNLRTQCADLGERDTSYSRLSLCLCQQGTAVELALGLHMLAGNLIWLVPHAAEPGMGEQVMERLSCLSDVILPESYTLIADQVPAAGTARDAPGLWVKLSALRLAVEVVLAVAVESVPCV